MGRDRFLVLPNCDWLMCDPLIVNVFTYFYIVIMALKALYEEIEAYCGYYNDVKVMHVV